MANIKASFDWKQEPAAEALILDLLKDAEKNAFLKDLKENLEKQCSTGLIEWVDHIGAPASLEFKKNLEKTGFVQSYIENGISLYCHPGAQLPRVALFPGVEKWVAISVELIADFLQVRGLHAEIEGSSFSGYRRALVAKDSHCKVFVVERRGVETLDPIGESSEDLQNYFLAKELWMTRARKGDDEERAFQEAEDCVKKIVMLLGQDRAASLILSCERAYWQARNSAGQIQKNRQDRLGMGWANHDHHTFRSSRKFFSRLVLLFENLGFHCRERFYAGKEAGWGAQVMENPRAKLVLFLDVDLLADEIGVDFAHQKLPEELKFGTIGLWCALHGDSILSSGMHHLEAQFHFEELEESLKGLGVPMMKPFSHFSYLKQAFTKGEMWPVAPKRIKALLKAGKISEEEAEEFTLHGAIGSHMENLQRKEGYKGFNQNNVSLIIKETDPRKAPTP